MMATQPVRTITVHVPTPAPPPRYSVGTDGRLWFVEDLSQPGRRIGGFDKPKGARNLLRRLVAQERAGS